MTFYLFLADRHGTVSGARWAIMGIAVKLGQSVSHCITTAAILLTVVLLDFQIGLRACFRRRIFFFG